MRSVSNIKIGYAYIYNFEKMKYLRNLMITVNSDDGVKLIQKTVCNPYNNFRLSNPKDNDRFMMLQCYPDSNGIRIMLDWNERKGLYQFKYVRTDKKFFHRRTETFWDPKKKSFVHFFKCKGQLWKTVKTSEKIGNDHVFTFVPVSEKDLQNLWREYSDIDVPKEATIMSIAAQKSEYQQKSQGHGNDFYEGAWYDTNTNSIYNYDMATQTMIQNHKI